ncbi:MAG: hypothetical protein J5912_03245 [Clostridia bacterium]|nr:hypothetical protein [Clostridia bacterium]
MKKRIIIAAVFAVLVFALAALAVSCDFIHGNPGTNTGEEDDNSAKRTADFFKKYEGTWTAIDESFIDFTSTEGKVTALFGIWNAGGDFPVYEICDAVEKGQDDFELEVRTPKGFKQEAHVKVENGRMTFTDVDGSEKVYEYNGARQFPPEENLHSLPAAEILTVFGGLRSAQGDLANWYIDVFQAADGSVKMARGEWTGDGYTEVFTIKSAVDTSGTGREYELVLVDETGAEKRLPAKLYDAGNVVSINLTGSEEVAYLPDDYENHKIHSGVEFVELYGGTWHCADEGIYAHFEVSGGMPRIVFGKWGSTDVVYPTAQFISVKEIGKMHYTIVLQKSDESYTRECDFVISQGGEMTITDDEYVTAVFVYDPARQLAGPGSPKG